MKFMLVSKQKKRMPKRLLKIKLKIYKTKNIIKQPSIYIYLKQN